MIKPNWIHHPTGRLRANGYFCDCKGRKFYVQGPEESRWWLYEMLNGDWEYVEKFRRLKSAQEFVAVKLLNTA